MKRREFLTALAVGAVAWPDLGFAQQARTPKRVGLIAHLPLPPVTRFRETLRKLGWVEGENLVIEFRYGEGRDDHFPGFAAELVSMPVDVLVVWGTPAAFAAKRATTTIPILIAGAGDVVNTGLVSNLARPDANLTGFIALNVDLESKRLELLKEAVPGLSRVAVLANPANPLNRVNLDIARRSGEKLGVKIEVVEAKSAADIDDALAQNKEVPAGCGVARVRHLVVEQGKGNRGLHGGTAHPRDLPIQGIRRCWRVVHLRRQYLGLVRAGRRVPGQVIEGRESR